MDTGVEAFRRATTTVTRTIAGRNDLHVQFARGRPVKSGATLRLPPPSTQLNYPDVSRVRGEADAFALRLRYNDPALHRSEEPSNSSARALFEILEQTRCEAIGAMRMTGLRYSWLPIRKLPDLQACTSRPSFASRSNCMGVL